MISSPDKKKTSFQRGDLYWPTILFAYPKMMSSHKKKDTYFDRDQRLLYSLLFYLRIAVDMENSNTDPKK